MGKLATDETLQMILSGLTGTEKVRTAKVVNINFDETMFESGDIDITTGTNKNGSGFYRTSGYITIPENKWKIQLYADRPWGVRILYYDANKEYQEYENTAENGCCSIKDYPYCRLSFYFISGYIDDVADFISDRLKIQYISNAPAENEYFLHNYIFNGNFEFDRNEDGVADGWTLKNSPTSSSVADKTQYVTPSASGYFIAFNLGNRLTGHQIYFSYTAYTPNDICNLGVYGTNNIISANNKYTRSSKVVTAINSGTTMQLSCGNGAATHEIGIRNVMVIDLTDIYGAGNEPTAKEIDDIVDEYYGGYVPCEYVCKYDDGPQIDALTQLSNIKNELATSDDELIIENGFVTAVKHYVDDELRTTTTITRDNFGNLISIEEVWA